MGSFLSGIAAIARWPDRLIALLDDVLDRLRSRRLRDGVAAVVLLLPAILLLGVFGFYPLLYSIYMSFFGGKFFMGGYVGLDNFREALTGVPFWRSLLVTAYYALGTVPLTMLVSFFIAYGLFRIVRGRGLFRIAFFLPYVTSAVAAAMVWRAVLNPHGGLANALLQLAGVEPQQWILEPKGVLCILTGGLLPEWFGPSLALCCVVLFDIWHASGFMVVIFLAGLTAIPRELEEAARIDGAGGFCVIRRVILPLLSPTIFFLAIVSVIKSFQAFNSFYALTGGQQGFLFGTQNATLYIYSCFYESQRLSYGAAVATLLCIAIIALTLIQWRFVGRKVHYE